MQPRIVQRPCDLPDDLWICPAEIAPPPAARTEKWANEANKAENIVAGDLCRQKLAAQRKLYRERCLKPD